MQAGNFISTTHRHPRRALERPLAALTPELVEQALSGDRAAIRSLVSTLTPVLQARAVRVLGRSGGATRRNLRQEVEDMTQAVFVRLFADGGHRLRVWDPDRGLSLVNFAGLVAEREVASIMASRRRSPWTEDPRESIDLDRAVPTNTSTSERKLASRQFLHVLLERMRAELSPLGQRMLDRLLIGQQSATTVASELHMSADAIHAWHSRLRKLARRLADELQATAEGRHD